jgi:phosphorylcholine metabolism protein LicD
MNESQEQETIEKLISEIDKIKKRQRNQERMLKSQQVYLNNLYLDYDLKPKGVMKRLQELSQELLNFVSKVCEKYELVWWMDYGNLLGTIRHNGFIPWDDDMDISMMRNDFMKFSEIIEKEIKLNKLDDILRISTKRKIAAERVVAFMQIRIYHKVLYGGLDILPKDFISNPPENIKNQFSIERDRFHENVLKGMDLNEAMEVVYENLNLSLEKQEFIMTGVETPKFPSTFMVVETDSVFPLKELEFNGTTYPCPKNYDDYLSELYGEYREIPRIISRHERSNKLKQQKNVEENFKVFINRIKEANENFIY